MLIRFCTAEILEGNELIREDWVNVVLLKDDLVGPSLERQLFALLVSVDSVSVRAIKLHRLLR